MHAHQIENLNELLMDSWICLLCMSSSPSSFPLEEELLCSCKYVLQKFNKFDWDIVINLSSFATTTSRLYVRWVALLFAEPTVGRPPPLEGNNSAEWVRRWNSNSQNNDVDRVDENDI